MVKQRNKFPGHRSWQTTPAKDAKHQTSRPRYPWHLDRPNVIRIYGITTCLDFSGLALSILILFIGWIMDEGRKIQDEQELTV